MSKREKIILIVTVLVAFYGLFEFFLNAPSETVPAAAMPEKESLNILKTEMQSAITDKPQDRVNTYILERAVAKWPATPFVTSGLPVSSLESVKTDEPAEHDRTPLDFTYAGYLAFGDRKLAIINGLEYEISEILPETGYEIRRIEPQFVVLKASNGRKDMTLMLQDTDSTR